MITVKADGIEWPLEAFIDTHRYQRTRGETPSIAGADLIILTLSASGELLEGVARHADWISTVAFRARDYDVEQCGCCGQFYLAEDDCEDCVDWGYY